VAEGEGLMDIVAWVMGITFCIIAVMALAGVLIWMSMKNADDQDEYLKGL
jgi:hypothetical protein